MNRRDCACVESFASLAVTTDAAREYMLDVRAVCRQVILVETQTVALPADTQAVPQQTASPVSTGTAQETPVAGTAGPTGLTLPGSTPGGAVGLPNLPAIFGG